ncbi:SET domain-containing protein 4 [Homalodisca vitripennis]|nr:SET domain-containing protein 4 [Homalodisca vitripennis]
MMGRTWRRRCRRKCSTDQVVSLGQDKKFQQLVQWMKHNGWSQVGRLAPTDFPSTGRGLKALQHISSGDILATIPGKLLMTVETASKSLFGDVFRRNKLLTQQVLAAHIVFEKHLGEKSFWANYISSLPEEIKTPVFSSSAEIEALPEHLSSKLNTYRSNVSELFRMLAESMTSVEKCSHCDMYLSQILTEDCFLWAWFIINSRAVYISPEHNSDHDLILSDKNCLALAPYLDMFNHSNDAKVQAFFNELDGSYQIRTLAPYKRFSQVFIHYGDHSNLKLYLEYGFIMPKNIHDILPLTFDDVYSTIIGVQQRNNVSKMTYCFLKSHDLLKNIHLSADGMSWSAKALVYVLLFSDKIDPKTIQLKVYSSNFTESEMIEIFKIGTILVQNKRAQVKLLLQNMIEAKDTKFSGNVSGSFILAIDLYNEYLEVLSECEKSLTL